MASDFLTQVAQASWDPNLVQTGYTEEVGITVHDILWGVNKFNPVDNPGYFGAMQPEVARVGAKWVEMGFTSELRGFLAYQTSPTILTDPPPEGRLLLAMGFDEVIVASPAIYKRYTLDDIHLTTDSVHTGFLEPIAIMLNVDDYYRGMSNGVGNGVITFDAEAGPPTLACTFRGDFYSDLTSPTPIVYPYPQTDLPLDWGIGSPTLAVPSYRGAVPQTALAETLTLQVIPNDGTYTPDTITGAELRSVVYDIGNVIAPTPNVGATYGYSQTLLGRRKPDITLTIRVMDPGTYASPDDFNVEKIADDRSLISVALSHGSGSYNTLACSFDAYISDIIDYADDGNGLFIYTLKCQQALFDPNGVTASQALRLQFA